ncbi:uncharacterized protein LOC125041974 [Penaeus chinensis]|uniref:uncharacterized protein LOC125041974 n=1 Tax=Penaeus chinensis TaxID=139456 RepID=UPI001FB82A01|nr:uncharacterized protein LOC125041974 [Penaeus chinensis]
MWLTSIAVIVAVTLVLAYSPEVHAATLDLNQLGEEPNEFGGDRHRRALAPDTFASPGNIAYSVVGFIMAGSLLFVNLFDPFRLPVTNFFDAAFGPRTERRRRREAGAAAVHKGLEVYVAETFDALVASMDKLEALAGSVEE